MIWAVIMAGGQGTRFWPLSSLKRPKQLLPIVTKRTMIEETVRRLRGIVPLNRTLIVTNELQAGQIQKLFPGLPARNIIKEPCGRNTAPCIGLAAHIAQKQDRRATLIVLPADHVIERPVRFRSILKKAVRFASAPGTHVTLGLKPTFPATGYGYIEAGKKFGPGIFQVKRFVEKPVLRKARTFYRDKRFSWNSGMFIWRADTILESLRVYLPKVHAGLERIARKIGTAEFPAALRTIFPKLPSISIDYGVLERLPSAVVIRADIGWSDVGSWQTAATFWPKDAAGNAIRGKVLTLASRKNLVLNESARVVACVGVENLAVVVTPEAVLVCDKSQSQEVRNIPKLLRTK